MVSIEETVRTNQNLHEIFHQKAGSECEWIDVGEVFSAKGLLISQQYGRNTNLVRSQITVGDKTEVIYFQPSSEVNLTDPESSFLKSPDDMWPFIEMQIVTANSLHSNELVIR